MRTPALLVLLTLAPATAGAKPLFRFTPAGEQKSADPRPQASGQGMSAQQFEIRSRCLIRAYKPPQLKTLQGDTLFHTQEAFDRNVAAVADNMTALRKYLEEAVPCRDVFTGADDADTRAALESNIRRAEDQLLDQERLRRQYPSRPV